MVGLYSKGDKARAAGETADKAKESYRTPWRRDYARLIHSPSFRRLQGKTQVFPGHESDFYRNRLTHSLEVAQIAKSMAIRLNATAQEFENKNSKIEPDIVEFAGLAHDLGHPPFGHNGEAALDECMREYGGFEGNAQSLRIVSKLEKKSTGTDQSKDREDSRFGLDLTYRSLASLLKYDRAIPEKSSERKEPTKVMKGYYLEDRALVNKIKKNVLGLSNYRGKFKTIECSIMDIADDIAYSTYDLEDNFKAGFLTPMGLFALGDDIYDSVAKKIAERFAEQYDDVEINFPIDADLVQRILFNIFEDMLFEPTDYTKGIFEDKDIPLRGQRMLVAAEVQALSNRLAADGHHRVRLTSKLVQTFLFGVQLVSNEKYPQLSRVRFEPNTFLQVEVLKNLTYYAIIRSPLMQVVEYRGKDIVSDIFKALTGDDGTRLLPTDFRVLVDHASEQQRMRTICDFIAGMTDRYAFEFYGRLYGTNHLTIHKPL